MDNKEKLIAYFNAKIYEQCNIKADQAGRGEYLDAFIATIKTQVLKESLKWATEKLILTDDSERIAELESEIENLKDDINGIAYTIEQASTDLTDLT